MVAGVAAAGVGTAMTSVVAWVSAVTAGCPPVAAMVPLTAVPRWKPVGHAAWCSSLHPLIPAMAVRSAACSWMSADMARCCVRMMLGRAASVPGVADTTLNSTQRGCYAQIEIMQQGFLRHVNANRCGEITDCKEGGKGINPDFLVGRVAIEHAKKAQDKKYDKPFCAVKRTFDTFTGFEYGPVLLHSLKGVTHLGFLIRDLSAASANPFEERMRCLRSPDP